MATDDAGHIASELADKWPRFLALLRDIGCGIAVLDDRAASEGLLEFKGFLEHALDGDAVGLWQDLWQRPNFCVGSPNSLLSKSSTDLLVGLCAKLKMNFRSPSLLLITAVSTHMRLLRACLEHAPPAQQAQLAKVPLALALVVEATVTMVPSVLPAFVGPLAAATSTLGQGQGGEQQDQDLQAFMQQGLLGIAADALQLATAAVHVAPSCCQSPFGTRTASIQYYARKLNNWAAVLERAETCTWWREDPAAVELPMLLLQLTEAYFQGQDLGRGGKELLAAISGQAELVKCLVRGTLRCLHGELEQCIQGALLEEDTFAMSNFVFATDMGYVFRAVLPSYLAATEGALEAWLELVALGHEAWEVLAQRFIVRREPLAGPEWRQMQALEELLTELCFAHTRLHEEAAKHSPRMAQHSEAATLSSAAAAMHALRTACELARRASCGEERRPAAAQRQLDWLLGACASRLGGYLRGLYCVEPYALGSPAAQRPDGGMALAAALSAVRLGEALLRLALGGCRQQLLRVHSAGLVNAGACVPSTFCWYALKIAAKWAQAKIQPADRGRQQQPGQPVLWLLRLTVDGSGLHALLSLLATLRKLAHALAQGVQLGPREEQAEFLLVDQAEFQCKIWESLQDLTAVALDMASHHRGGSRGRPSPAWPSREQEAALCLAIPTGFYLASCISPRASSTGIVGHGSNARLHKCACRAVAYILLYSLKHGLMPCALRLGGGTLLTRTRWIDWETKTSPRAAVEAAMQCMVVSAGQLGLLQAAVQGGLVQQAAEMCLAWLRSDGFQVSEAIRPLLEEMHLVFLKLCKAAQQAGLHRPGTNLERWSQAVARHDCGFLTRFPRTKRDQERTKAELLHAWGLRAGALCPHMWRAASATVRGELAAIPEAVQLPEWIWGYVQRPLCGRAGSAQPASLSDATQAASRVVAVVSQHISIVQLPLLKARRSRAYAAEAAEAARAGMAPEALLAKVEEHQQSLSDMQRCIEELPAEVAQAEAALPAEVRGGGAAAEEAPGSTDAAPSTAGTAPGPLPAAQPLGACPAAYALREVAVSQVGCANVHCCNFSGASESELPRLLCRGCLAVRYCSEACGQEDWARHGQVCRLLRMVRLGMAASKPSD